MLKITIPSFCVSEIEYSCFVVFTEWLGINYEITTTEKNSIFISSGNNTLRLNADFFIKASSDWLGNASMPALSLECYNLNELKNSLSNELHVCETELPIL